ncbi:MAG TPA: hypothetical protein VHA13_00705, partial [Gammaproteobacteria bacterium]|nr:hypothetical protein [Gammaproteobacteria bacterium]
MLNWSLIGAIFVIIINLILGIVTLINHPKHLVNISFALVCFFLSAWTLTNFLADNNLAHSLLWTRLSFTTVVFALTFLVIFANSFPTKKIKGKLFDALMLITGVIVAGVTLLPAFIPKIVVQDGVSNVVTGSLYFIFLIFFFGTFIGTPILLLVSLKRSKGSDLARIRYLMVGMGLTIILAAMTNLILPLILGQNSLARYGSYFSLFFLSFTAYAIIKHKLFDIRLVVARSMAYLLVLLTIGVSYALVAFRLGNLIFHDQISTYQQAFNIGIAIVLAFTFQPLKRFFEKITDRIFYRDKYDPQALLNNISRVLAAEIELVSLSQQVIKLLSSQLRVKHVDIIALQGNKIFYEAGNFFSNHLDALARDLVRLGEQTLVSDELAEGDQKEILRRYGISVFAVLKTHKEKVGYLLFSDKRNGDIYNGLDLRVINIVVDELAIAVQNAKSYTQIEHFNETLKARIAQATKQLQEANSHLQ